MILKDYVTHLEYIRACEDLWQKGMYVELHAYQHHVFMDWRFVEDSNWELVHSNLKGAGVESMQAKWEEMFGTKDEKLKVKKPRKKAATKKKVAGVAVPELQVEKKSKARKTAVSKETAETASTVTKRTRAKKPKTTDETSD